MSDATPVTTGIELVAAFQDTKLFTSALAFCGDGTVLAAAGEDDHVRLYRSSHELQAARGALAATLALPQVGCYAAQFASGGAAHGELLVAPRNPAVYDVFSVDAERGEFVAAYHADQRGAAAGVDGEDSAAPMTGLSVGAPGQRVFAAAKDNSHCCFFQEGQAAPVAMLHRKARGHAVTAFSHDGSAFAFSDALGVHVYDWRQLGRGPLDVHRPAALDPSAAAYTCGVQFHPADAARVLVTSSRYRVVELTTGAGAAARREFAGDDGSTARVLLDSFAMKSFNHKRSTTCAARYSPGGRSVAVGTMFANVLVFDGGSLRLTHAAEAAHVFGGQRTAVNNVAWNPATSMLVSTGDGMCWWATHVAAQVAGRPN
jgi:WD40 repeat protein